VAVLPACAFLRACTRLDSSICRASSRSPEYHCAWASEKAALTIPRCRWPHRGPPMISSAVRLMFVEPGRSPNAETSRRNDVQAGRLKRPGAGQFGRVGSFRYILDPRGSFIDGENATQVRRASSPAVMVATLAGRLLDQGEIAVSRWPSSGSAERRLARSPAASA